MPQVTFEGVKYEVHPKAAAALAISHGQEITDRRIFFDLFELSEAIEQVEKIGYEPVFTTDPDPVPPGKTYLLSIDGRPRATSNNLKRLHRAAAEYLDPRALEGVGAHQLKGYTTVTRFFQEAKDKKPAQYAQTILGDNATTIVTLEIIDAI